MSASIPLPKPDHVVVYFAFPLDIRQKDTTRTRGKERTAFFLHD